MTHDIVDGLLENQKDLAAQVGSDFQRLLLARRRKSKLNLAGSEEIAGKATHTLYEIAKVIFVRIDCPDNVAHRIYQVARSCGDYCQRLADRRFHAYLMPSDLTQNRNA